MNFQKFYENNIEKQDIKYSIDTSCFNKYKELS